MARNQTKAYLWQILLVILVLGLAFYLFQNLFANLQTRGISSGFAFLAERAGFDISFKPISYSEDASYGRAFLVGLANTFILSVVGIISATIFGFSLGIMRLSSNKLLSFVATSYIELVRNIPLLLQIFFWYFAVLQTLPAPRASISFFELIYLNVRGLYLPSLSLDISWLALIFVVLLVNIPLGLYSFKKSKSPVIAMVSGNILLAIIFLASGTWSIPELKGFNFRGGFQLIPEFVAMAISLCLYTAGFIGEIVRAGILSVSKGQLESIHALGLSRWQGLRLVVIPQAMRVIIPPLTSQYLNLMKNSSLASAIAFPDLVLVFAGTVLNQTGQAFEVILMTMLVYLILSLSISLSMNYYNSRTRWGQA